MVTVVFSAVQWCSRVTVVFDDESSVQRFQWHSMVFSRVQWCSAVAVVYSGGSATGVH